MIKHLLFGLGALMLIGTDARSQDPISVSQKADPLLAGEQTLKLQFGGDVMLARDISETILEYGPGYIWGDVLPILKDADITIVNLECVIGTSGSRFQPERAYYFQADPLAIDALSIAGNDFVSLANNHAMDFGSEALMETLDRLEKAGIRYAGAGRNRAEASKPSILSRNGIDIAIISITDHFIEYAAGPNTPGTNLVEIEPTTSALNPVANSINEARRAGAEIVVVSAHWGSNWQSVPSQIFIEYAHAVIDAGADIFHGHSAHIFQGIEIYNGKLIMFDIGDLIDDYIINPELRNDYQITVGVTISAKKIHAVEIKPLVFEGYQVTAGKGRDFRQISRMVQNLSSRFDTEIHEANKSLFVNLD